MSAAMNARLSAKLIRYSIENATESAGIPHRKRSSFALPLSMLIGTVAALVALWL